MIKLPNKLYTYNESVISKFSQILAMLNESEMTPLRLYEMSSSKFEDVNEFIDTLTCLYALNRIELINNNLKIHIECYKN